MLLRPGLMRLSAGDPACGGTTTAAASAGAGVGAAATTAGGAAAAGSTAGAAGVNDGDDEPFSRLVLSEAGATLSLGPLELDLVKASGITILLRGPSLGIAAASLLVPPLSAMFRADLQTSGVKRDTGGADWALWSVRQLRASRFPLS